MTTDPTGMTTLNTEAANETRAEAWMRYYEQGRQQSKIAAWEFARRLFRERYGRNPKPSETRML